MTNSRLFGPRINPNIRGSRPKSPPPPPRPPPPPPSNPPPLSSDSAGSSVMRIGISIIFDEEIRMPEPGTEALKIKKAGNMKKFKSHRADCEAGRQNHPGGGSGVFFLPAP